MAVRVLHFADAHIDIGNYGRHDPATGLPQRVVDFLAALDQIIDAAIAERVDLVIFAGDAYKDRNPQPTFQRAWGERMMRLSRAGIPTLLLVGNHDVAPADNRANTLQEFATLAVPRIFVADNLKLWTPAELGLPVQVLALPWVTRSRFGARHDTTGMTLEQVYGAMLTLVQEAFEVTLATEVDPELPLILTAHASVQGARLGSERQIMLGHELVLSEGMVSDPRFDYVALGHIHKHQALSERPPVVYAGSIERIDFGEAGETKGYVLAEVDRGHTTWRFMPLKTRPFVDRAIKAADLRPDSFMEDLMKALPPAERLAGAICRVQVEFAQEHEALLDEKQIREHFAEAFDFRLIKHRLGSERGRLPSGMAIETLSPYDLLALHWRLKGHSDAEVDTLLGLARQVLAISPETGTSDTGGVAAAPARPSSP
jgi:exonuclease SbcD